MKQMDAAIWSINGHYWKEKCRQEIALIEVFLKTSGLVIDTRGNLMNTTEPVKPPEVHGLPADSGCFEITSCPL